MSKVFATFAVIFVSTILFAACGGNSNSNTTPSDTATPRIVTATQTPIQAITGTVPATPKQYSAPPPMTIDVNKTYTALMHTNLGDVTIALKAKDAPITVNSFIFLAKNGFYNGVA